MKEPRIVPEGGNSGLHTGLNILPSFWSQSTDSTCKGDSSGAWGFKAQSHLSKKTRSPPRLWGSSKWSSEQDEHFTPIFNFLCLFSVSVCLPLSSPAVSRHYLSLSTISLHLDRTHKLDRCYRHTNDNYLQIPGWSLLVPEASYRYWIAWGIRLNFVEPHRHCLSAPHSGSYNLGRTKVTLVQLYHQAIQKNSITDNNGSCWEVQENQ